MDCEENSNDTTMISELLKSAEVMQNQQAASTSEIQHQRQIPKKMMEPHLEIPPLAAIGPSSSDVLMLNQELPEQQCDANKLHQQLRHVHIPYILNGELYQIQTQEGENVTVKCCHCPPDRVYRGSVRSTGNFHMHIKRRHPDLLEKLHDMKVNALLERRDRLMRNRKITSRNNRSRPNPLIGSGSIAAAYNEESKFNFGTSAESVHSPAQELGLLQSHNLKIKTVFQRHQMQQREAAEMRNWNNSCDGGYAAVPIKTTTDENTDAPINYSLKSQQTQDTHSSSSQQLQHEEQQSQITHNAAIDANVVANNGDQNVLNQQQQSETYGSNEYTIYHNQQLDNNRNARNASTSSLSQTSQASISPSILSSYTSSVNHSCNMDMQPQNQSIHQTLSIVKPEALLMPTEQQAIDLTMHNDSGIYSDSNESFSSNSQNTSTNEQRAGSQHTARPQQAVVDGNNSSQNMQELLMHVDTSLRDIQHEMNIRNQIESNRMFLDIAKFKFLHPGFQFNW